MSNTPSPATPFPALEATAMLELAPLPMFRIDATGAPDWVNAAARAWLHGADATGPVDLATCLRDCDPWRALQGAQAATADLQRPGAPPAAGWVRASSQPLPAGGWIVSLQPLDELQAARAGVTRLQALLDLARDFGRLGVWERNVRTLEGAWDSQVLRIWGLDPNGPTPSFDEATQNIAEADRAALQANFRASLRRAGRYTHRFRVRGSDGTLRRVQSQWVVINGTDGQPERVLGLMMDDSEPYSLALQGAEAESQLALAVDLAGIAVWRHDLATDRVQHNAQGYAMLDLEPRPAGLTLQEARARVHPDDLPQVLASTQAALASGRPVDTELRYLRAKGGWRQMMTRRVVQRDAGGQPLAFLGVSLDISERIEQTRRADEATRRFELVTRTAGIGYWSLDRGAATPHWSLPLRTLFGLDADAPIPAPQEWFERWVHPADRAATQAAFSRWMRQRAESVDIGFRILRGDGQVRQLITHSRREAGEDGPLIFGVVIDVTEQRSAEQALRGAEERAALAARGVGLGTWQLDLQTGAVLWDEAMWALRGLQARPQPLNAAERLACVHPDDRERAEKAIVRATDAGTTLHHEFRVVWPDGQVRWLASRSAEVRDEASGSVRRIGVNWDVTDSRTAAAVRLEREIALRESQAKSKFLARMSHELRTPLNAVLGFTQLMLADETGMEPASASRQRRLQHVAAAGGHLLTLINDVLDLASLESGELRIALEPVALQPLVAGTLPLLGTLLDTHPVQVHLCALDCAVQADATRLRQVLLNLLSNALKYNRPGGDVRIDCQRDGNEVLLRVADTGRGMSAEQQRHLFEPFNRLGLDSETIEGSGIGLAIAKSLVERMGGTLRVQSSAGVGSVFELRLAAAPGPVDAAGGTGADPTHPPGAAASAPPAHAEHAAPAAPAAHCRRLLYIEDNPVNALIISELFARREDLTLEVAVDGAGGVAAARAQQPDLILLDMQLPDADGFEVLQRLRADPATAGIACIALSANAMPEDIDRALQAGISAYWTKPLDFKAFMASIDTYFSKIST